MKQCSVCFEILIEQKEYVANKVEMITMAPERVLEKKEKLTAEETTQLNQAEGLSQAEYVKQFVEEMCRMPKTTLLSPIILLGLILEQV